MVHHSTLSEFVSYMHGGTFSPSFVWKVTLQLCACPVLSSNLLQRVMGGQ